MELDKDIKTKIDEYFKNHSDEEGIEILNKLGIELPKKEISDEDLSIKDALRKLYLDIYNKGIYLRDYTYCQYDYCFEFSNRLYKLICRIYGVDEF